MVELQWGAGTHPGRIRGRNEDNLFVGDGLFIVADGMGGHEAGEVASQMAVDRIRTVLSDDHTDFSDADPCDGETDPDQMITSRAAPDVINAVRAANADIFRASLANPSRAGMGTTITAIAVIKDSLAGRGGPNIDDNDPFEKDALGDSPLTPRHHLEALVLTNVGDSRTYLYRHDRLHRVTVDHNYVQELVASGHITDDEARSHPRRNIITRALGIEKDVTVDWWTMPLVRGDRYVLCSDGLVDEVTDAEIAAVLGANRSPQQAVDVLIDLANEAGGRDNITIVVVDVLQGDDPPAPTQELNIAPKGAGDNTEPIPQDLLSAVDGYVAPEDGDLAVVPAASSSRRERRALKGRAKAAAARNDSVSSTTDEEISSEHRSRPEAVTDSAVKNRRRWLLLVAGLTAVSIVVGVAGGAWARRGYYVSFDTDREGVVTVFQGRHGGVLWIEPTVAAPSELIEDDLAEDAAAAVRKHPRFSSEADAVAFVRELERASMTSGRVVEDPTDEGG